MKKLLSLLFVTLSFFTARAADTNPPPQLTVQLRDGSKVIGASVQDKFKLHSTLLGDIKLAVKDIRSIECTSTNSAKLTSANGDSLAISLLDSAIKIKTSFGNVELSPDSIRKIDISPTMTLNGYPSGLIALWSGDGDGKDSVGGHDAQLTDVAFSDGKNGQAFSLNGSSSCIKIPANSDLNVGKGDGMTITAWVKPSDIYGLHPILEWNPNIPDLIGVDLWIGDSPSENGAFAVGLKKLQWGFTHCILVREH